MKSILYLMLFFSPISAAEPDPFSGSYWTFVNGKSTEVYYSEVVQGIDSEKLNSAAKKLQAEALNLVFGDLSRADKLSYINAFPSEFDVFLSVFHPPEFNQLYDGQIYIDALKNMMDEFPNEIGKLLLQLSSKACLNADAPNYLQDQLQYLEGKYPKIYKLYYGKIDKKGRSNIDAFKTASLHDMGAGSCSF